MKVKKKKIIIALSFLVFLGILFPFKNALAWDIFSYIADITVANFARGIVWALSGIFGYAASFLLETGQALLAWVISSDFMGSVSMTNNPIVNYGWGITRDIANIFLLLGLVVIGLGIILGLEEYQVKKSLPKLIAMALLINFTPVICGFFIDFSNILMNYLLGGGTLPQNLYNAVVTGINNVKDQNPYAALLVMFIYFVFGIAGFIAYSLYALLFIVRYLFLWILIIFSPIAFASNVFPSEKIKNFFPDFFQWQTWWKQFLEWCAIGIYAAFFILLANKLMVGVATNAIGISAPTGKLSIFGMLFSYAFPLLLLFIGLDSVKKIVEQKVPGAGKVMGLAQTAGIAAVTGGAGLAIGAAAGATVGASKGAQEGQGLIGKATGALKGTATGGFTAAGREEGVKWYRKTAEKIPYIGPKPGTYDKKKKEELAAEMKMMENMSPEDRKYYSEDRLILTREGHRRRAAAKNVQSQKDEHTNESIADAKSYKIFGFDEDEALKHMPNKVKEVGSKKTIYEVVRKQAPADFAKNVQAQALENFNVFDAMSPTQMKTLLEKGSEDKKRAVAKTAKDNEAMINTILAAVGATKTAALASKDAKKVKECEKIEKDIAAKWDLLEKEGYL